jgi:hypothetical protein
MKPRSEFGILRRGRARSELGLLWHGQSSARAGPPPATSVGCVWFQDKVECDRLIFDYSHGTIPACDLIEGTKSSQLGWVDRRGGMTLLLDIVK